MALTYAQYLAANRLKSNPTAALNWLRTAAAPGTPVPAALQSAYGSSYVGSSAPAPTATPAAPAPTAQPASALAVAPTPAASPLPAFQDPYLPQETLDVYNMLTLPQQYNPQRQLSAADYANQLQGYYDLPAMTDYTKQIGKDPQGNIRYGVVTGPDGRLYWQAYQAAGQSAAAHGAIGGSYEQYQMDQQRQALNQQRDTLLGQQQQGQLSSLSNEMGQYGNLMQDYTGNISAGAAAAQQAIPQMGSPSQTPTLPSNTPAPVAQTPTTGMAPTTQPRTTTSSSFGNPKQVWSSFINRPRF